jgi:hypothetical protein
VHPASFDAYACPFIIIKKKIKFETVGDMRERATIDHRLFQFKRSYGRRHEHVKKSINYSGDGPTDYVLQG